MHDGQYQGGQENRYAEPVWTGFNDYRDAAGGFAIGKQTGLALRCIQRVACFDNCLHVKDNLLYAGAEAEILIKNSACF